MDVSTIIMVVVVIAALYFLMIRPQQKRAKQQKEHMASLQPGARVMTVHGIFGTLVHVGEKQVILEVSPGVELTLMKAAISNQPVEDEFEYDDEPGAEPDTIQPKQIAAPVAVAAAVAAAPLADETPAVIDEPVVAAPEASVEPAAVETAPEAVADLPADDDAASPEPGTSIPDFTDDESFSAWWDEHFPKN